MFTRRCALVVLLLGVGACQYQAHVHPAPMPEPSRRTMVVNDIALSYELTGDSASTEPTVVLLHGFGASMETWSDILPALARERRVLRLDMRGFGLSDKPHNSYYSARDQAELVAGLLDSLHIRRAVLVGHSFGGSVAFMTYLQTRPTQPDRIAGLVFIDPGLYAQSLPYFIDAFTSSITRWLMYTFTTADWRAETVLKRVYAEDSVATPERIHRYSQYFNLPGAHYAFEQTAEQIVPPDAAALEEQIKTIRVPTLAIWGHNDDIVPEKFAFQLREDLPTVTLRILDDTGHAPHEERPAETAQIILGFLRGLH